MIAVAAATVGAVVAVRSGRVHPAVAAAAGWAVMDAPLALMATGTVVVARSRWRGATVSKRAGEAADEDIELLAELLAMSLRSGASLRRGLGDASPMVDPLLGADVGRLIAEMDRSGTRSAFASPPDRLAALVRVVQSAADSGAPASEALEQFADRVRHEAHMHRVGAARRLPVRLLLPLALLILPGFVVLTVGPAVIEALARLNAG